MPNFRSDIEPGQLVRHPQQPAWGVGQVQSVIDDRITVNFPGAGKVVINARVIDLAVVESAPRES
jgi:transcription elongation factor GreA-like protein